MARERYQPQPRFESNPAKDEVQAELHTNEAPADAARRPQPLNSHLDSYDPATISQAQCIERLRAAGLLSGFETYEACGAPLAERIVRTALALDSLAPITPETLGALWLAYMHEDVIEGGKILSNAVVGYANRNRIGLPRPGVGANGHRCTFEEEMKRRCA